MPVAVWPSFHARPSTASTLLSPSASMRQTPTTFTNELASAPTVSFEKSSLSGSAATASSAAAATVTAANGRLVMILIMIHLLGRLTMGCVAGGERSNCSPHGAQRNAGESSNIEYRPRISLRSIRATWAGYDPGHDSPPWQVDNEMRGGRRLRHHARTMRSGSAPKNQGRTSAAWATSG